MLSSESGMGPASVCVCAWRLMHVLPAYVLHVQPYIVTADVARAFDSLDISRLTDLTLPILSAPQYHVARYGTAPCTFFENIEQKQLLRF